MKSPWEWKREYGCNYPVAGEHIVTFRSAAAGFYDIANDGGTGNFGGFKSGCTSNLVIANGVLNAPDYTRTCQCAYQNQTSLALVNMPEVETWTYNIIELDDSPIKRVGINFGAPGDRMADDGTLWLEYPMDGGPSPDISVKIKPEDAKYFRHHSSRIGGEGLKWVAASGSKGLNNVEIKLMEDSGIVRPYTVRLYFVEPENIQPAERVFDVSIQGVCVLKEFDIIKETHKPNKILVKEFNNIGIKDDLNVSFKPNGTLNNNIPLICGIEVLAEGW